MATDEEKQKQQDEQFEHPTPHAERGILVFKGKPKVYQMGYLEGHPHVTVESFKGEGVVVTYAMVGIVYSWLWEYRNEAWEYARGRQFHIEEIKAAGNEYANRARR
jgi:hypothetical protein